MDASDLRVFEAVARLGSMSKASEELCTVQSNVTARIRKLEEEVGAPLLHRTHRGVTLTSVGKRLFPYCTRVEQLLDDALRATIDDGTPRGRLMIGSLETTAAMRLSPVLATFGINHPSVDLTLRTDTTDALIGRVLDGELDGAFICGPADHPELDEQHCFEEDLVLLTDINTASPEAAFARTPIKLIVLNTGCSYRKKLEHILSKHGHIDLQVLEFGTLESIFSCVAAGLGITLMPERLLGYMPTNHPLSRHDLPRDETRVATVFIRRKDSYASSAERAFVAQALAYWAETQ